MSLVADYSDSSESDVESSSSDSEKEETSKKQSPPDTHKPLKLPSASDALDNAAAKRTGDVFSNPFLEAELNKTASLERHVKMVNNDAHLKLKNGRKICWNYRKGRCRFGTSCQYAHDSDLSVEAVAAENEPKVEAAAPAVNKSAAGNKRKRPGLSDGIEPGKRVMKSYQQQQLGAGARR
ncbi:hypothetical protein AWZ03_004671 [Drosophila navojoa]|uniref:C3H1-type domain-containing protein n=1 Tax=Drosophila navojoa TaxID=7232 RepID=A0A484BJM6_DRONA|nr:uncharacterized protein LOC108654120 [Drosophila navojoa]TDG48987.1 hypothetical protein AWZ03_004671 [Drosophila navojoa]